VFADFDGTDDPFWRARTEDANGRVYGSSQLADVEAWRSMRLSVDLADLFYRRTGFLPHPHEHRQHVFTVRPADCEIADQIVGDLTGRLPPLADGAAWPELIRLVCEDLNLVEIANQGDHRRCRHVQPQAALPLMWRVAQMVCTGQDLAPGRRMSLAGYAGACTSLGYRAQLVGAFDRECRWIAIEHLDRRCFLSPTGRVYFDGEEIDLAALHTDGLTAGDLAAVVDEGLSQRSAPSPASRMGDLARRAGLGVPAQDLAGTLPPWLFAYRNDETLIIGVPRGVPQEGVDGALACGLAHLGDRDLHLILPAETEQPTVRRAAFLLPRVRVWVHDGYRITAAPLPALDEVFAEARQESWQFDRSARDTIRDRKIGQAMSALDELQWQWLGHVTHTGARGLQHLDLARGKGPALRVVVDASDPDDMTVLHAVDQWIWATANLGELRWSISGVPAHDDVLLTFVVGAPDDVAIVEPWTDVLLEMIDYRLVHSQLIRVGRYDGADPESDVEMTTPLSSSPVEQDRPVPRWPAQLQHHLAKDAGGWFWPTSEAAIISSARPALHELQERGVRLDTRGVASAEAFAINLFGPLDERAVASIFESQARPVVSAERPHLAWTDPGDRLREADHAGADRTFVDVLLRGVTDEREQVAILVCVKLAEEDFAECNYHQHPANTRRSVCRTEAPFGGDPAGCFQVRRRDPGNVTPRYAEVLDLTAVHHPDGGCPFRVANEQMRYLALAAALRESGDFTDVRVVLCAPLAHDAARRRLRERSASLRGKGVPPLGELPADLVLLLGRHPQADAMRERYGLVHMAKVDAGR
jgi:hypothetical protein